MKKKLQILVACIVAATAILWVVWSYIAFNRPTCPICKSDANVLFTWKSYKTWSGYPPHKLTNLFLFGVCEHNCSTESGRLPDPHFAWYCFKCSKQIRKPPGWRGE